MTDLPPDVRAEAAGKVGELLERFGMNPWRHALRYGVVDAVTAVVAPEIERPLQARIAELEAENERLRRTSIVDNAYTGQEIKVEFDDE